jgi:Rab GDP dissociation inhibitor
MPQRQLNRQSDIYITLISSQHQVCKDGYFIAIVSATIETENPEQEIEPALKLLGPVLEKFVSISNVEEVNEGKTVENLHITNSYDATSHFEIESQNIFDIFKRITGQSPHLKDYPIE